MPIARTLILSAFIVLAVEGAGPTSTAAALEATAGLVGAWSFDEPSGLQVLDQSGSGNDGTLTNVTRTSSGRFGGALSFDGVGSVVIVPSTSSLRLAAGMTLEAWVRPTAAVSGWRDVLFKGNDDYYLVAGSDRGVPAGGGIFGKGGAKSAYGDAPLTPRVWTHLATTYDGSLLRLYVDGRPAGRRREKGRIRSSNGPLQIGGDSIFGRYFRGDIDEVRVYDYPLSASQIQRDMATPVSIGGVPQDTQAPTAPGGLAVQAAGQSSVALTWDPSTDDVGVTGYDVLRDGVRATTVTTTSVTLTSLVCGTTYAIAVVALDAAGNRSPQAQLTVSTAACTPASPTLQEVDGGLDYYSRFSNALPSGASFFPIAVWGSYAHEPANINVDKAVGLNTYVWAADPLYMADIRAAGMHVIQAQEERDGVGSETAGWLLADELDMTAGPTACPTQLAQLRNSVAGDGRFVFDNYGKGVMFWQTDAEATCFVNFDDVNSADIYWMTDANVCTTLSEGPRFFGLSRALTVDECRRAANYGYVVDKMRRLDALDGARHPIWNFVEVGCPFDNGSCIDPAQARAAVWHSLIAGARGILYFNHSFGGPNDTHHVLRDSRYRSMIDTITAVDAQITRIAPVLNGPTLTSGFTAGSSVRAVAKWDGSKFYVVAGSRENAASTASFSLPCVGAGATATVLDEGRTLPVSAAGAFTDSFTDGNAIHIYRIDGGSRCGLDN